MRKGNQLTVKQRLFVIHYLATLNGTKAARLAGYAGDDNTLAVVAYENLRKPKIREAIESALHDQAMSAVEVLSRLADHARSDMGDFASVRALSDLADHPQSRLVKKFKLTTTIIGTGDDAVVKERLELELYDAQAATVHIGRYHKLFVDRVEMDDWRSKAIDYIRNGEIEFDTLVREIGHDLATQLFESAGVPVADAGKDRARERVLRQPKHPA